MRITVSNSSYPIPTPDSDRGEELSVAYVSAIAAHAGIRMENVTRKDYGTDATFKRLRKRKIDNHYYDMGGIYIPCQIKSACHPEWRISKDKDIVTYDLRAKNYNDLVGSTHGFLILMCLPSSIDLWLQQDEECLRLYKCCYYWTPGPDDEETSNKYTKTIHIPLNQLFTVDVLTAIVDQAQPRV
jgi:uncharacterized protein DUF4365